MAGVGATERSTGWNFNATGEAKADVEVLAVLQHGLKTRLSLLSTWFRSNCGNDSGINGMSRMARCSE
jgi:hypothetical protein